MVAFTLSQSVWEFAKSCAIRAMRASVVYVPTCKTRANFSFLRANGVPVIQVIRHVSWLWNYCTAGTAVLEDIFIRNRKKHSHNKVSYNYLQSPIQADHNSSWSQYSYVFFFSFSCFSREKFEKTLINSYVLKPGLFISSFLTKEQNFLNAKIYHTFFNMTWSIELKYNTIFM